MGVLKLKSDKKKREKAKETKIDYAKCLKRTKIKEKIIRKDTDNEFDLSIFAKTDHASNKIRQLNYAKLVKAIRKDKNLIANHVQKILEIYGKGIIDDDENVRNYSSKIFYHLVNSHIDFDVFHSKIKTCLFHSLKIGRVSLKVLNLELCHNFFFTKIHYSHKFFYEFLSNIMACFVSLPIEKQVTTVKYLFLLFKHKARFKRGGRNLSSKVRQNGRGGSLEETPIDIAEEGGPVQGEEVQDDESSGDPDNCYEFITRTNKRNSCNDPFLLKKEKKTSIQVGTKMEIFTKVLQSLYNFMDEVVYNSMSVDLIHLYTNILKVITFMMKKKKIILKEEIMTLINNFLHKTIGVINEHIVNLSSCKKVLKIIFYFVLLVLSLCGKEMNHMEDANRKVPMNYIGLLKYCLCIYFYALLRCEFFTVENLDVQKRGGASNGDVKRGGDSFHIDAGTSHTEVSSDVVKNFCDRKKKRGPQKNVEKYGRKYFYLLVCLYEMFIHRKDKKMLWQDGASREGKTSGKNTNQEKSNKSNIVYSHADRIIKLLEKNIRMYDSGEDVSVLCGFVLKYLSTFSQSSIDQMDHFCYFVIILAQRANGGENEPDSEGPFVGEGLCSTGEENTQQNSNQWKSADHLDEEGCQKWRSSFPFLTTPFMFVLLADCECFINNNFFNTFFEAFNEEEKTKTMEAISFVQNGGTAINIVTRQTFNYFVGKLFSILYRYDNALFVNNCLLFLSFLTVNKRKVKKAYVDFNHCIGTKLEMEQLLRLDVRTSLDGVMKDKGEILIDHFLGKNRHIIHSFEIICNLYFVYENRNRNLLLFIYFLILKFEREGKSSMHFALGEEEAMVLLDRVFRTQICNDYTCVGNAQDISFDLVDLSAEGVLHCDAGVNPDGGKTEEDTAFHLHEEKCTFRINKDYLYRENFLLFFLKMSLSEWNFIVRNDIYKVMHVNSSDRDGHKTNGQISGGEKYDNLILIIKRMAFIISNVTICIENKEKNLNNFLFIMDYLFGVMDRVGLTALPLSGSSKDCDRLFVLLKVVFLFYFASSYLSPCLLSKRRGYFLPDGGVIDVNRNCREREVTDFFVGTKEGERDLQDAAVVGKEHTYYNHKADVTVDVSTFVSFVKDILSKDGNMEEKPQLDKFAYLMPNYQMACKYFDVLFEQGVMYTCSVNDDLEKMACENLEYNLSTHIKFQNMLMRIESSITIVSFRSIVDLPVKGIIKLLAITIFKMSLNRNILYGRLVNNSDCLLNESLYDLNFFIFFHHFVSCLIERVRNFSDGPFSQRSYYSISFLIDILLCAYCIMEEVAKTMEMTPYRGSPSDRADNSDDPEMMGKPPLAAGKGSLEKLNERLRCILNEIPQKEKRYHFPRIKLLVEKYL
ncbi:conserved Plasmodium protein, unknown function [Plasmodium knowlesi strain H]|uniref:Uncharacterized protein n=3 Tax=Plasmodium knowlesi TaxID=5850 RepID=A0A5K1UBK3_PLAKH|nr:conserved Plasmodium protein, unknown function [Plasmodium knowlesi strain H]OTN68418.1 Uncharacterized protein PKNOH_S02312900 [Plasmodium knowlesi]CAA9986630.1 conserved Plasmodium protein, unknown function [Plasmodium knowlesi strain H]SBO24090.1 conserved Plasmodium protein, unknown function [Plasmodium knowlesi strain H]SBO29340.1 conserved Plasmodium protein, unknown function [Plasmodium knowlesi strain H]VVS76104.1 conserved Plasmodium protein, unknown function [Plasmodium knowlesi s|eukprot:XP_002261170.1 hypothetical protein, conserved in Plasmodium species [Plasmodium knowlesi strain H]